MAAWSGGVDSTVVAVAAHRALGSGFTAVTVASEFMPGYELDLAVALAARLGLPHVVLEADLLGAGVALGPPEERCYRCKRHLLREISAQHPGLVLDGTNADDDPARPGLRALAETGACSPLRETGLDKAAVRGLARKLGLPNADKPANSCLATRIRGARLDRENLRRVEVLERLLVDHGIDGVRARVDDMKVIVEVPRGCGDHLEREREFVQERIRIRAREFGWELAGFVDRPEE